MGTKMKGLIKGLRYISHMFENDKEKEMQIGYPTDVKHVAHIGWDGPSVDSPSWMKEFPGSQSAPLNINGESKENPEIKWVSGDSSQRSIRAQNPPNGDTPELRVTSRRHSADSYLAAESPIHESTSSKHKPSRLRRRSKGTSKESGDSTKLSGTTQDPAGSEPGSPASHTQMPDIPKKSRRKKTKDSCGSVRSSRSKATTASSSTHTSPFSDTGEAHNLKPEEEKGR